MSTPSLLAAQAPRPLADRLRPARLSDVAGQDHLLGPDGPIGRMVAARALSSMVLWGPPGCGKTTIARLLAQATDLRFESISALQTGVADLRKLFETARQRRDGGQGTLLFCDEVHHFNRNVQDSFLPHLEDGTITLVGATTENPSFELNAAILSRVQVFVLRRLDAAALDSLLARAEEHVGRPLPLQPDARAALLAMADGDGRFVLNMAEQIYAVGGASADAEPLDNAALGRILQRRMPSYDKSGDGHYNLLSAFHKSLRASDANAALYWMCRMLDAGEDPRTIARRMVCVANEDVGLADPNAILQATAAWDAYERLGAAEGERALAQACLYLATAPKSNAVEVALGEARRLAKATGSVMPPMHAVNAPTRMMADLGYKQGYIYDHDTPEGFSGLDYFPESVGRHEFYRPVERGFERDIRKRLDYWAGLRRRRR
ncbi:replication-associated recombination protein A [Azospirillum agricola]|uniref:replication-associated recombination protein A n=1 Tax=Azospirillum agricola TaxID=1720247 RepID=UPI000A0EFE3F|nr:replication-associated recombination protein A [Azospirillum agricola]SMH58771.1 Recombination protein MgsA [Azospirillum lipoferum]